MIGWPCAIAANIGDAQWSSAILPPADAARSSSGSCSSGTQPDSACAIPRPMHMSDADTSISAFEEVLVLWEAMTIVYFRVRGSVRPSAHHNHRALLRPPRVMGWSLAPRRFGVLYRCCCVAEENYSGAARNIDAWLSSAFNSITFFVYMPRRGVLYGCPIMIHPGFSGRKEPCQMNSPG